MASNPQFEQAKKLIQQGKYDEAEQLIISSGLAPAGWKLERPGTLDYKTGVTGGNRNDLLDQVNAKVGGSGDKGAVMDALKSMGMDSSNISRFLNDVEFDESGNVKEKGWWSRHRALGTAAVVGGGMVGGAFLAPALAGAGGTSAAAGTTATGAVAPAAAGGTTAAGGGAVAGTSSYLKSLIPSGGDVLGAVGGLMSDSGPGKNERERARYLTQLQSQQQREDDQKKLMAQFLTGNRDFSQQQATTGLEATQMDPYAHARDLNKANVRRSFAENFDPATGTFKGGGGFDMSALAPDKLKSTGEYFYKNVANANPDVPLTDVSGPETEALRQAKLKKQQDLEAQIQAYLSKIGQTPTQYPVAGNEKIKGY